MLGVPCHGRGLCEWLVRGMCFTWEDVHKSAQVRFGPGSTADVDRQCRFRYTTFDFAMIFDCVKVATVFRPNTDSSNDYSFFRLS